MTSAISFSQRSQTTFVYFQFAQSVQIIEHASANLLNSKAFLNCFILFDVCFFFFSSRRRHTRCSRDWSSDVCSSDLSPTTTSSMANASVQTWTSSSHCWVQSVLCDVVFQFHTKRLSSDLRRTTASALARSEERRVGKECGLDISVGGIGREGTIAERA